jgi:hypothetical protein
MAKLSKNNEAKTSKLSTKVISENINYIVGGANCPQRYRPCNPL